MEKARTSRIPVLAVGRFRPRGFRLGDKSLRSQGWRDGRRQDCEGRTLANAFGFERNQYPDEHKVERYLKSQKYPKNQGFHRLPQTHLYHHRTSGKQPVPTSRD